MVRVADPAAAVAEILTGLVVPKLSEGVSSAPGGLDVMVAVSVTFPVKPPLAATVIVDVLFVVAPGLTVTEVPAMAKPGVAVVAEHPKMLNAVPISLKVPLPLSKSEL
jgi:hypothetical protein